jgi:hypothetical protein
MRPLPQVVYINSGTIYNQTTKARLEFLKGRSPIEALIEIVSRDEYFSNYRMNGLAVESLFFTHQDSVQICKRFSTVLLIDCTYKTNKFNMPLLNIVGITCTYQTFNCGFAFIDSENEDTFTWVLQQLAKIVTPVIICTDRDLALMNAINVVLPQTKNLLCVWHINQNVLANCKKHFDNDDEWQKFLSAWSTIVYSPTVEEFHISLDLFKETYSTTQFAAWNYIHSLR